MRLKEIFDRYASLRVLNTCTDGHDWYACQRVEEKLGCALNADNEVGLHLVRSVAPNKDMYCISFRLTRTIAFGQRLEPIP